MVISPHDDDALLGAGYAMAACQANGGTAYVCILCDGRAGYSRVEERDTIVATRQKESIRAYNRLGIDERRVFFMGFPDFSLVSYVGWKLSSGTDGTMRRMIELMRENGITRLMIPNGYREHSDHEAAYDIGRYDGVQAGDPVAVDWGPTTVIKNTLQYSVWADFSPEDALLHGADTSIRANRAIVAEYGLEDTIAEALAQWESQGQIIHGLLEQRRERDCGLGLMELYIELDPRPKLPFAPYADFIRSLPVKERG